MNNIKLIIFDFDGTMSDSKWIWEHVNKIYFKDHGIDLNDELKKSITAMSSERIAEFIKDKYKIDESISEIIQSWNEIAIGYYKKDICLQEGLEQYLCFLKKHKIKIGIATGGSKELVDGFLTNHDLTRYIDLVVDTSIVKKGKPFSDIYQYVADYFKVNYEQCLVYEDVIACLTSVSKIGMKTCFVYDEKTSENGKEMFRTIYSFKNEIKHLLGESYVSGSGI